MAGETKGKRKVFFSKDLRDPIVSAGSSTKRTRGFNSTVNNNE